MVTDIDIDIQVAKKVLHHVRQHQGCGSTKSIENLLKGLLQTDQSSICWSLDLGNIAMIERLLRSKLAVYMVVMAWYNNANNWDTVDDIDQDINDAYQRAVEMAKEGHWRSKGMFPENFFDEEE